MKSSWYVSRGASMLGPFTLEQLQEQLRDGQLAENDLASRGNGTAFYKLSKVITGRPLSVIDPVYREDASDILWFVHRGEAIDGPLTAAELLDLHAAQRLFGHDLVRRSDAAGWMEAKHIGRLLPASGGAQRQRSNPAPRSASVAAGVILAAALALAIVVLGFFGGGQTSEAASTVTASTKVAHKSPSSRATTSTRESAVPKEAHEGAVPEDPEPAHSDSETLLEAPPSQEAPRMPAPAEPAKEPLITYGQANATLTYIKSMETSFRPFVAKWERSRATYNSERELLDRIALLEQVTTNPQPGVDTRLVAFNRDLLELSRRAHTLGRRKELDKRDAALSDSKTRKEAFRKEGVSSLVSGWAAAFTRKHGGPATKRAMDRFIDQSCALLDEQMALSTQWPKLRLELLGDYPTVRADIEMRLTPYLFGEVGTTIKPASPRPAKGPVDPNASVDAFLAGLQGGVPESGPLSFWPRILGNMATDILQANGLLMSRLASIPLDGVHPDVANCIRLEHEGAQLRSAWAKSLLKAIGYYKDYPIDELFYARVVNQQGGILDKKEFGRVMAKHDQPLDDAWRATALTLMKLCPLRKAELEKACQLRFGTPSLPASGR